MKELSRRYGKVGRVFAISLALVLYLVLLTLDAIRFFPTVTGGGTSSLVAAWTRFGLSALVSLAFLAVGSLVWLYVRKRQEARLLFFFSVAMMATFVVQTGALANDPFLSMIGAASANLAMTPFFALLLLFPHNYLARDEAPGGHGSDAPPLWRWFGRAWLIRRYLGVLALLSVITLFSSVFTYLLPVPLPDWLNAIDDSYYVLVLSGIIVTPILSYVRVSTWGARLVRSSRHFWGGPSHGVSRANGTGDPSKMRAQQQLRLFLFGVVLAFTPVLVLTILPMVLNQPQLEIDSQISTLSFALLPLALGYSLLRYQILVFDAYIRRTITRIVGGLGLALLCYLVVILSSTLPVAPFAQLIVAVTAMGILVPPLWQRTHTIVERLFFPETLYYRRLVNGNAVSLVSQSSETFDLAMVAGLIVQAAMDVFETREIWLFVLAEETGCYELSSLALGSEAREASRQRLSVYLRDVLVQRGQQAVDWIAATEPFVARLAQSLRPLLLSEVAQREHEVEVGLDRYLTTTRLGTVDPLLVPIHSQGKLIGMLLLGERGDHQQYAGPDFEPAALIAQRFSPVLESARLYAKESRHVAILNILYSASLMRKTTFKTIETLAIAYARIAAEATQAGATLWLYEKESRVLRRASVAGYGPPLTQEDCLPGADQEGIWSAQFYVDGAAQDERPAAGAELGSLFPLPPFPFAWLPLRSDDRLLGVLVLTYARPHRFLQEEKRVVEMFAGQCSESLANAQFTLDLSAAYERQKELDQLKDQFITTASHELRTPLTAVRGYIELMSDYFETLGTEDRKTFLKKVQRGCDELELMLENIMDAGRLQFDTAHVRLEPVVLTEAVSHVLEMFEAIVQRERRAITVMIPPQLKVNADAGRLRQVILNLISNALKYSPEESPIEICASVSGDSATVRLRDYGLGIPPEERQYLFERFVRLERDLNSPVRGAGLGLNISKQLIEAMGGRLWVESSGVPGEGSTLSFTLATPPVLLPAEQHAVYQEI